MDEEDVEEDVEERELEDKEGDSDGKEIGVQLVLLASWEVDTRIIYSKGVIILAFNAAFNRSMVLACCKASFSMKATCSSVYRLSLAKTPYSC